MEFIDPGVLASVQRSIVGVVTVWEESDTSAAPWSTAATLTGSPATHPVISICTGWFDSPTTIASAGHCVDPKLGREELDWQNAPTDPQTGQILPPPTGRPDPKRTVWAFQPRELPGAVLHAPVIVHVDAYRSADDGDTAKLDIVGVPAATPLPIAASDPQIGEPVTSIGFAGMNIGDTDGVDLATIFSSGGQPVAQMLQDSRLQPVNTSGTITSRQFRGGVPVSQVSADFDQGMSGGPTINARGEVYGINSKMTVPFFGQNFNVISDTTMLRRFLTDDRDQISIPLPGAAPAVMPGHGPIDAPATDHDPDGGIVNLPAAITGLVGIGLGWLLAARTRATPKDASARDATAIHEDVSGPAASANGAGTNDAGRYDSATDDGRDDPRAAAHLGRRPDQ